jgi:hypothetical protein
MLTNTEKINIIESRIKQIDYNVRDNIIQIEDIRKIPPVDEETIDAINFHIIQWLLKKIALENELNIINENVIM